jgi:MinD-like ATPase involved in chromosome partitioning or flagellar assembly
MNRANARVHLDISDVESALGVPAEFRIPSDIAIPQAVNRGVPVVLDKPRSPAALALRALADRYASADPGQPLPTPDVPSDEPRKRGWRR